MSRQAIIFPLLLLFFWGCSENSNTELVAEENEFDQFCDIFTALSTEPKFDTMDTAEKYASLDKSLTESLSSNSDAYIAWTAVSLAEPSQRYQLFKDAAVSSLKMQWDCQPLKDHANTVGQ